MKCIDGFVSVWGHKEVLCSVSIYELIYGYVLR